MLLLGQIGLLEQLVNLLIRELLAEVGHGIPELFERDRRPLRREYRGHGLDEFVFGVGLFVFLGHEGEEFGEVDFAGVVGVHLLYPLF